jgi:hypothetical protein
MLAGDREPARAFREAGSIAAADFHGGWLWVAATEGVRWVG